MSYNYKTDLTFVRDIAQLVNDTQLAEIEIERSFGQESGALKIRITRVPVSLPSSTGGPTFPVSFALNGESALKREEKTSSPLLYPEHEGSTLPTDPKCLTSPMIGTVYLSPEPGSPPFVELEKRVEKDQIVMIIEAMKTMNHITAQHSGVVRKIFVQNGQPVEFGTPLMIID